MHFVGQACTSLNAASGE